MELLGSHSTPEYLEVTYHGVSGTAGGRSINYLPRLYLGGLLFLPALPVVLW